MRLHQPGRGFAPMTLAAARTLATRIAAILRAAPSAVLAPFALAAAGLAVWPAVSHAQSALEVLPVQGNVFMIAGPGGNMTVQVGHEAVVLVDTMTEAVSGDVLGIVEGLSDKPIRHIILTSDEPDHPAEYDGHEGHAE